MHIAIATTSTPLVSGGAEYLCDNLKHACEVAGHEVSIISKPFADDSPALIKKSVLQWQEEDFSLYGKRQPDMVIGLKFPAFYAQHDCQINWLLHQYRGVYDLWDWQVRHGHQHTAEDQALREQITRDDSHALQAALQNFTISRNVSQRLLHYNGIVATTLYHPPALADYLMPEPRGSSEDYIFAPSRLEPLKRQVLLIEALALTQQPVKAIICGRGSQKLHLNHLINHYQLTDRVQLITDADTAKMVTLYRHAFMVFFAPFDEDYGYVTLEAMAAGKPVLTSLDAGGPNEFVIHDETGFCEAPEPVFLAERIDKMYANRQHTLSLGDNGFAHYQQLDLRWSKVTDRLLS